MTKQYEKRLIALAKDLQTINEQIINEEPDTQNNEIFMQKLNFLLGYIQAIEEPDEPVIRNGEINIKVKPEERQKIDEILKDMKGDDRNGE